MVKFWTFTITCPYIYRKLLKTVNRRAYRIHAKMVPIAVNYGAHFNAYAKINGLTLEIYAKQVRFMVKHYYFVRL